MARPGWNGVWAVGVVRARGGVGTHWQPLNTSKHLCKPGVGVWQGGVGCGLAAFKYSLNTKKMRARSV